MIWRQAQTDKHVDVPFVWPNFGKVMETTCQVLDSMSHDPSNTILAAVG
eukprot:SAG31_NODE_37237_length_306_cov_0.700483_1_plen_48_part_01